VQFSPTSCHIISLRSKYSPQHPVLKHPQSMPLFTYYIIIRRYVVSILRAPLSNPEENSLTARNGMQAQPLVKTAKFKAQ
jgi:hypothetical protein